MYEEVPYFVTTYEAENPPRMYMIPEYRISLVRDGSLRVKTRMLDSPAIIFDFMKPITDELDREVVFGIYVDQKHKVVGLNEISVGSLSEALVHPREVLKPAVLLNAAGLVMLHNHPSGDPAPSRADISLSKRIAIACAVLGFRMLDFVVSGYDRYYSSAESGHLPVIADYSEFEKFLTYQHQPEYSIAAEGEGGGNG